MSTSPGKTGGVKNRQHLEHMLPYLGANIAATYSLPSFYQNMQDGKMNEGLFEELNQELAAFLKLINV